MVAPFPIGAILIQVLMHFQGPSLAFADLNNQEIFVSPAKDKWDSSSTDAMRKERNKRNAGLKLDMHP